MRTFSLISSLEEVAPLTVESEQHMCISFSTRSASSRSAASFSGPAVGRTSTAEPPPPAKGPLDAAAKALKAVAAGLNPMAAMRRRRERKTEEATMAATLAAFPNDNALSNEYYDGLMAWLVKTGQVEAPKAQGSPPSTYWTNEIAL